MEFTLVIAVLLPFLMSLTISVYGGTCFFRLKSLC